MLNKERPPAVNLEEGPVYGTELGDLGIVAVAAGISIVFLLIALFPPPFAKLEQDQIRSDIPDFRPGDTLKVHVRVTEGTRSRIQVFQGIVIRRQGGGARETFTVRKISYGVGVERTFPVHSPTLEKIELVTRGRVRRAKLYYLRELRGKAARIKERR